MAFLGCAAAFLECDCLGVLWVWQGTSHRAAEPSNCRRPKAQIKVMSKVSALALPSVVAPPAQDTPVFLLVLLHPLACLSFRVAVPQVSRLQSHSQDSGLSTTVQAALGSRPTVAGKNLRAWHGPSWGQGTGESQQTRWAPFLSPLLPAAPHHSCLIPEAGPPSCDEPALSCLFILKHGNLLRPLPSPWLISLL